MFEFLNEMKGLVMAQIAASRFNQEEQRKMDEQMLSAHRASHEANATQRKFDKELADIVHADNVAAVEAAHQDNERLATSIDRLAAAIEASNANARSVQG